MASEEGWAWPVVTRKAHYFSEDRSLCNRWPRYGAPFQTNQEPGGPDACKECTRRVAKVAGAS